MLKNVLFLFSYKLLLDLSYILVISKVWNYSGFGLHLNSMKLVESFFLLLLILVTMPRSNENLSHAMLWILVLLSYIPMLSLFALKDESRVFMYAVTVFWITISFFTQLLPRLSLQTLKEGNSIRFLLYILLSAIVFLMIYNYLGLSVNFNLTKVYEIRERYSEAAIPFAGYLFHWLAYIVNPLFFSYFIIRKRWYYVLIIVSMQLLLFFSTGNKSFLFALILVLVLMKVITRKNPIAWIMAGLIGILSFSMMSWWLIEDLWVSSLLVRRTLFIPAQLAFYYYDFFSHSQLILLSDSIFRFFTDYPYHLNPAHLISEVYFNKPEMASNTGIVGNAYMNFGLWGMFFFGLIFIVILKLIDSSSNNRDVRIGVAAISMPTINLINSGLLTTLLTHGLLLAVVLLYLFPSQKQDA